MDNNHQTFDNIATVWNVGILEYAKKYPGKKIK